MFEKFGGGKMREQGHIAETIPWSCWANNVGQYRRPLGFLQMVKVQDNNGISIATTKIINFE